MYKQILEFWFAELEPAQWWVKDSQLDRLITEKFLTLHESAVRCELYEWRDHAQGRLAEIIILDQFSRNMFRGSPLAFASDPMALALAQEAIAANAGSDLSPQERTFLYMPFMHSESLKIHVVAVELFEKNGLQANLDYEIEHMAIIEKFGRYPHRNEVLGRESTAEERAFLQQPGSGF
jgi:uncharacterized protein (DUF924 family)